MIEVLDRAVGMLARARSPFVYGLAQSPVGTARLAARLAERLDAALDIEGGDRLAPEIEAIAATGQVTATFGEMRSASDGIVLWRTEANRDRLFPAGPGPGRTSSTTPRRFIVIPPAPDSEFEMPLPASDEDDFVVPLPAGCDLEALQWLRLLIRTGTPGREGIGAAKSVWLEELAAAADSIRRCGRVVILWDPALAAHPHELAAGFALLTLDPRPGPRIAVKAIGATGHVIGAMAGLLAATGYPRAIAFRRGEATSDPVRFGAGRMLSGGADLVVAIEPSAAPPVPLRAPLVLIGSRRPAGWPEPDLFLPIAPPREAGDGLWLAEDGVPEPATEHAHTSTGTAPASTRSEIAIGTETGVLTALLERLPPAGRLP